jgi:hypothetical protein
MLKNTLCSGAAADVAEAYKTDSVGFFLEIVLFTLIMILNSEI